MTFYCHPDGYCLHYLDIEMGPDIISGQPLTYLDPTALKSAPWPVRKSFEVLRRIDGSKVFLENLGHSIFPSLYESR